MSQQTFSIKRTGAAIGDHMMAAFFVQLLNDNGIPAVYGTDWYRNLVDVPLSQPGGSYQEFYYAYHLGDIKSPGFDKQKSFLEIVLEKFRRQFNIHQEIKIKTRYVPVKYTDIPAISGVDVALVTKSGVWSKYRNWPHFPELKSMMRREGISFIDLTERDIRDVQFLNYVKKSKVYVGLDTGPSHYGSQWIKNGIILQSGFSNYRQWSPYPYTVLDFPVDCSPCFISVKTRPYQCSYQHRCMANLASERVMTKIKSFL